MPTPKAIPASADEFDRAIGVLVAAFVADPFIRWLFPDARQYFDFFPRVLKFFAGAAFENDSAYRSDDFTATACWLPPGAQPDEEALGEVMMQGVSSDLQANAFAVLEQVGNSHPAEAHYYLPAIGVEPMMQGRGYGSILMARGVEECDRHRTAAYLESTNPANIPLYERFGFETIGEIRVENSPVLTRMIRRPGD